MDRYTTEREIGRGGMAIVFLAQDLKHHRPVAIKVLRPELAASLGAERFLREIQTAARLTHPHILPLYDSGEADGLLYYVMPYVEGESLRQRLERERQLPLEDALAITRQVAAALSHAHSHDVVHRDIKPENVLLSGGEAVVSDFGIARAITAAAGDRVTETGVPIGTPAYMSPEQAGGESQIDGRSDVYSLACVLYEMLVGAPPFTGPSAQAVMARHSLDPVPPVRTVRATVPPHFEQVITKAMAKIPADRYAKADDFVQALLAQPVGPPPSRIGMPARLLSPRVTLSLGAIVLILAGTWFTWHRWSAPAGPLSPNVVAVLPFAVRGGEELAGMGDGMVDLLSTKLDGAGGLRAVDPRALLAFLKQERIAEIAPELGARAAVHFGAGRFVLGSIVDAGGQLQVSTAIYDHNGNWLADAHAEGQRDDLPALVDDVARQVALYLSGPEARVEAVTTSSLAALKTYLEGLRTDREGKFDSAVQSFQRAVADDGRFALAWYRLGSAAAWLGQDSLAEAAVREAARFSAGLSQHDRLLVEAAAHMQDGSADEAEQRLRAIVRSYPDDAEAWWQLGKVLNHWDAVRGRPASEGREAYERVRVLDPAFPHVYQQLAVIAAREKRIDAFDSLARRFGQLSPQHQWGSPVFSIRPFLAGDTAGQKRLMAQARDLKDRDLFSIGSNVAELAGDLDGAIALLQLLDDPSRDVRVRSTGRVRVGYFELARGRRQAAAAALEAAVSLDSTALEHLVLLSLAPFIGLPRAKLGTLRIRLNRWVSPEAPSREPDLLLPFRIHDGVHRQLRVYLLGMLTAQLGESEAALRYAEELEGTPMLKSAGSLAGDLALGIRAEVARLNNRASDALAALERTEQRVRMTWPILSPFYSRGRERFIRAELADVVGRPTEAIRWYTSFDKPGYYDAIYVAPSHLRRGEIYEKLGEREQAAEHYAEFVERWKDCDPEFRPLVEEARQRIARLTGEQKR